MKKVLLLLSALLVTISLAACGEKESFDKTETISVYTRDTSSGTRAGFFGKIGFETAESDDSVLADGFIIAGNDEIISAVQNDEYAIGYISLSTLDTTLFNGLNYEGVEPTEKNVLDGSYLLARRFNYMLRDDYSVFGEDSSRIQGISEAFVAYMGTLEGKATIASAKGIVDLTVGESWDDIKDSYTVCATDNSDLTIKFGGSDSVEKIAKALSPDFAAKCGNFVPEHNHTGSSNAWKGLNGGNSAIDDGLSIHIGFASREFKDTEVANTTGVVAIDAIVAVTNIDNPVINITADELKKIYGGTITTWEPLIKE